MVLSDAHVFPSFLTLIPTQLYFQSHRLLFSHASAEARANIHGKGSSPQPGIELKPPGRKSDVLQRTISCLLNNGVCL